jgi:hypothetical protein
MTGQRTGARSTRGVPLLGDHLAYLPLDRRSWADVQISRGRVLARQRLLDGLIELEDADVGDVDRCAVIRTQLAGESVGADEQPVAAADEVARPVPGRLWP